MYRRYLVLPLLVLCAALVSFSNPALSFEQGYYQAASVDFVDTGQQDASPQSLTVDITYSQDLAADELVRYRMCSLSAVTSEIFRPGDYVTARGTYEVGWQISTL